MDTNEKNFLTLFNGRKGWDREAQTYETRDDGVHILDSNDQWEWWYFDFSFDNGYKAVATFHYHNMMMMPHIPTMQLFVYPSQGYPKVALWALRPGQENYAAKDRCNVKMGNLTALDTGDGYRVQMDMKQLGIDVVIRNVVRPWKAGTGVLWSNPETSEETGWVVAVPRGTVEGKLKIDGQVFDVNGLAYHDHNYGNSPMEKPFRAWYWGRLFDPDFTLIYGWVMPRDKGNPVVSPFMLARGQDIVLSTDLIDLTVKDSKVDDRFGFELPMGLQITCDVGGVNVECELITDQVVEALELSRGSGFFHYYRFLAKYKARIRIDGTENVVSGETFHEAMYLD